MSVSKWLKTKRNILIYSLICAITYSLFTIIGIYYFPIESFAFFINVPVLLLLALLGFPSLPPESNRAGSVIIFLTGIIFYFLIGTIVAYILERKKK